MKLSGYIKQKKENTFRVPVYTDSKGVFYFHAVDERYNIIDFVAADFKENTFQKLYLSKKFRVGAKGAIVFAGRENYLHYHEATTAIDEIIHYLNDHSTESNINAILDEAMLLKNRIFSDHFVVDNFVVKMNPQEEQIVLSFDFPSPKKEALDNKNTMTVNHDLPKRKERPVMLDQETDAAFTQAIRHLNSVDMNFELKLKLRAEERRSKLKMFNYQFKLNQNTAKRRNSAE